MTTMKKENFYFWTPITISKAKDEEGDIIMKMGGVASTMDEDTDGEFLNPKGFDLSYFTKSGIMNWHHLAKTQPSAVIGEPTTAKITKRGLEIECFLYKNSKLARDVYELAEVLEKNSKTRRLGFSIEGKVIERDPMNDKIITKARITGCAITHMPKNPNTFANIIKGEMGEIFEYEEEEEKEKKEKSLDTNSGKALKKESVEGKTVKSTCFSKGEVFDKIFSDFPDIEIEKADKIYKLISKISTDMKKELKITDDTINKAYEVLGLNMSQEEEIQKSDEEIMKKKSDEDDEEEEEVTKKAYKKGVEKAEEEEEEEEEESEEEEEEEEEEPIKKTVKKSEKPMLKKESEKKIEKSEENDILKGIGELLDKKNDENRQMFKAIGTVLKGLKEKVEELEKGQEDLLSQPLERKSKLKTKERFTDDITKGNEKTLSISRDKRMILNIMDSKTYTEKGIDPDFSKGITTLEAQNVVPSLLRQRILLETGYTIVD